MRLQTDTGLPRAVALSMVASGLLLSTVTGCVAGGDERKTANPDSSAGVVNLGTQSPGVISVAIRGDLPYAAEEDGNLTGIDGEIMAVLAEKLGHTVKIELMDFSGQLGAIESGRVDVAIGSIGWKPDRAENGLFTDPTYYAAATVIEPVGAQLNTLASLEGKTIGTVTGYAWAAAIEAIPGAKLRTYETADAVYADVGAKRIDAAFVDALQDIYVANTKPDLGIQTEPLVVSDAELAKNPDFAVFGQVQLAFYLPSASVDLEEALTRELRGMYESGELAEILGRWGVDDPKDFLVAGPSATARVGVDRPEGWLPPSML